MVKEAQITEIVKYLVQSVPSPRHNKLHRIQNLALQLTLPKKT